MEKTELSWDFKFAEKVDLNKKRDVVFDTECNNLLEKVDRMWCIVAQDYKTKEFFVFTDQDTGKCPKHGSLKQGAEFLASCRSVVAHNIMGYDWYVMNKFFPKIWNRKTMPIKKCFDTFIQSKCQLYERPARKGVKGVHGLAYYGNLLGYPKPPIEDWSFWDLDKLHRCIVDVEINTRTVDFLNAEKKKLKDDHGIDFTWQINIAKYTQFRCTQQEINGFKANVPRMEENLSCLNKMIKELTDEIEPQLPQKLCVQNPKATWEEVRDKWPDFFRRVPKTQYQLKKKAGEIVEAPIKETYMPTVRWISAKNTNYPHPTEKYLAKATKKGKDRKYTKAVSDWFDIPRDPSESDYLVDGVFSKVPWEKLYTRLYDTHTASWFDIPREYSKDTLVQGVYTKVYWEDVSLTQHDEVKKFLLSLGWEPDEWTRKKDVYGEFMKEDDGSFVKGSPKLTESSFESLPEGVGQKIATYNTLMHRKRTIYNDKPDPQTGELEKGWLNQIRSDGRLSAGALAFNTATGRMVQKGIVNVPSPHAVFGKEMREVWIADEGCDLVSTDMDSAQLVILAGVMEDERFTKAVKEGEEFREYPPEEKPDRYCEVTGDGFYKVYVGTDAHTVNSVYFTLNTDKDIEKARETQDPNLIHKITGGRKKAKNGIYAFLFGASDKKFATTVGLKTAKEGKKIKEEYFRQLPNLKNLKDNLEKQFDKNRVGKGGYIQIAGGVWLYCYSKHTILNYQMMGAEAQLQNCAIIWKYDQYEKRGIPAKQVLTIHDEQTDECPVEYTDQVKEIMSNMYYEASKILGLKVPVTGTAVAGKSYLDVH